MDNTKKRGPDSMASFFDGLAATWEDNPAEDAVREGIVRDARLPSGVVIADVGCGKGVMTRHLLKTRPRQIIAMDLSGEMIAAAQARYDDSRVQFLAEDFLTAALPPLDAVMIFNAYPHFLDKRALAARLMETVKPGGTVVIAHSVGRAVINGRHREGLRFQLSVPLEAVEVEAEKFAEGFAADVLEDSEERFFLRMVRR